MNGNVEHQDPTAARRGSSTPCSIGALGAASPRPSTSRPGSMTCSARSTSLSRATRACPAGRPLDIAVAGLKVGQSRSQPHPRR